MSIGKLCPSQLFEYSWFEFEGQEYWDSIPHSKSICKPSAHLRIVDGKIYQWWPIYEEDRITLIEGKGIWIKVPEIKTTNE